MSANDALRRYRSRSALPLSVQGGFLIVASAAAVISFSGLRALGERAGIPGQIAWLLPISIDAAALVAVVIWLTYAVPEVVAEARRLAWTAIGVSIGGNVVEHGLSVLPVALPVEALVLVAALVGAIAPGMFGAIVHLGVSAIRHRTPKPQPARTIKLGTIPLPGAPPKPPPVRELRSVPKPRSRRELEAAGAPLGVKRRAGETVDSLRERVEAAEAQAREERRESH